MKRFILFIFSVCTFSLVFAQDKRADVKTPNGNDVVAWITEESSVPTRIYLDKECKKAYPNAEPIITYDGFSSSRRFNCHGYAWHMSELTQPLSNPRWIGYEPNNVDEHIYWKDSSYVKTSPLVHPCKISWSSGDHSAISTSEQGWVISKWCDMPLMKHKIADSPYGGSNLNYYVRFFIRGTHLICTQSTYSIENFENLPSGTSVTWSLSNNKLQLISGQGTGTALFKKSGHGDCIIMANFNGITLKKHVSVGMIDPLVGDNSVLYLGTGTWSANSNCGSDPYTYDWYLKKEGEGEAYLVTSSSWNTLTLKSVKANNNMKQPDEYTYFYLYSKVTDTNGNVYKTPTKEIYAYGNVNLIPEFMPMKKSKNSNSEKEFAPIYTVFPNPAHNNLTVKIVSKVFSENSKINIKIYDNYMKLLKNIQSKNKETNINISNLSKGIYFLHIYFEEKLYYEKIIKE